MPFKPNPRGLLVAIERLGATAGETLYVGDRLDVDLPTAEAAGVRCAIISPQAHREARCRMIRTHAELQRMLWPSPTRATNSRWKENDGQLGG